MKIVVRILVVLVVVAFLAGGIAYLDGSTLPVNHSVSVTGVVQAPPDKVFAIIADVANGASWRPALKSVTMLPPQDGPGGKEDHWTEDLGHGQKMTFLAIHTAAPLRRDVLLDDIGRRHRNLLYQTAGYFNPTTSASASTCST